METVPKHDEEKSSTDTIIETQASVDFRTERDHKATERKVAKDLLTRAGILIDPSDNRSPIEIAVQFGLLHEAN